MGLSSIAAKQREKEVEALKSLLSCSLIGSLALHIGVLAFGIGNLLNKVPEITDEPDEPIEVAIIDSPNIKDVEPKEATEGGSASAGGEPRSNASTSEAPAKAAIAFSPAPIVAAKPIPTATKPKSIVPSPTQVTKPVTTPPPKVATQTKPVVTPSPIPGPSPEPVSTSQSSVAVNQPPQKVTPSVANSPSLPNQEQGSEQLRNLLAGVRNSRDQQIAASGTGTSQANAGASGNSIGSRFGTGSGSGTQTGIGTGSGTGTGTGTGNGRGSTGTGTGSGSGTGNSRGTGSGIGTGTGTGNGRGSTVATGSRRIRRAAPAAGSDNRDATGAGDDGVGCRSNCKPLYPSSARRRGEEGQPQVKVDIGSDGKATNVRLARSSGNRELDEAALRGVRRAKYKAPSGGRQGVLVKVDFAIEGSQRHRQLRERQKRKETARRNRQTNTAVTRPATQRTAERSNPTRRIRRPTSATQPSAVRSRNAATVSPRRSTPTAAPRRQRVETAAPRRLRQATPRSQTNLRQSLRRQRPTSQPAAPRSQSKLRNSLRTHQQRSPSAPKPATPNNSQ